MIIFQPRQRIKYGESLKIIPSPGPVIYHPVLSLKSEKSELTAGNGDGRQNGGGLALLPRIISTVREFLPFQFIL